MPPDGGISEFLFFSVPPNGGTDGSFGPNTGLELMRFYILLLS